MWVGQSAPKQKQQHRRSPIQTTTLRTLLIDSVLGILDGIDLSTKQSEIGFRTTLRKDYQALKNWFI
jgi:hypothetical protein